MGSEAASRMQQSVAFTDETSYDRYNYVSTFPEASFGKKLRVRLMKAFFGYHPAACLTSHHKDDLPTEFEQSEGSTSLR